MQRPVMTRAELMESIQLALIEQVPGSRLGPDNSALMKAQVSLTKIMALVDTYLAGR